MTRAYVVARKIFNDFSGEMGLGRGVGRGEVYELLRFG